VQAVNVPVERTIGVHSHAGICWQGRTCLQEVKVPVNFPAQTVNNELSEVWAKYKGRQ
jgi:hypothetical protein